MARVPEVLVVDQDPQARYEVKSLVKQVQLSVAGEAAFGTEAVSLASEIKPDVIVCGMSSPPERSLSTIEALLDVLPETPIIAYGWQQDVDVVRQTMLVGARNFFVMPIEPDALLDSIRSVLEAEEKKRLRLSGQSKAMGPRGLVITVFGAKGGVGKSTVATNLGVALTSELHQSAVLVDTAGSLNDLALAALEEANMVLWVTSSDYSSINNSVFGLETLQQLSYPDSRIRLMLNVISPDDSVRAGKIEEVLGRKFFWSIPYDRQVRLDGQVGRPAVLSHPDCRGAKSIIELAQALMGTGTVAKPTGNRQPGLRKLFTRRGGEASSAQAAEGS